MIKAVIFDFDDTLCLTEQACFHLENESLALMHRPPMSREIHQSTWGEYLGEAIKKRSPGIDPEDFLKVHRRLVADYQARGKLDAITEENQKTLDELASEGYQLMILTGREKYELEHLMHPSHHLSARISHFYHKDNNTHHKPDPRTFGVIEREHGLKPEECIYVGDSVGDAAAAKGANLHFIASLESGLRTKEDFKEYPVDIFISRFGEVIEAVHKIENR